MLIPVNPTVFTTLFTFRIIISCQTRQLYVMFILNFISNLFPVFILFSILHYPAEDKTLPFGFQFPLSILLLSADIIYILKQITVHFRA